LFNYIFMRSVATGSKALTLPQPFTVIWS
jgi:hypothetical protein